MRSFRSKPVGWRYESVRHSLAARGLSKVDLKRYAGTWEQVAVSQPEPFFQRGLKDVTAQYSANPDGTLKVVNEGKRDGKVRRVEGSARVVSDDNRNLLVDFGLFMKGSYQIVFVDKEYKTAVVKSGDGTVWVLKKEGGKRYLSKMDDADLKEYLAHNLSSQGESDFAGDVKNMFFHPVDELDRSWVSFERAAKQDGIPASDPVERSQERSAALVGNVVTFANVEPLIDHEDGMTFRQSMMDLLFGRDSAKRRM